MHIKLRDGGVLSGFSGCFTISNVCFDGYCCLQFVVLHFKVRSHVFSLNHNELNNRTLNFRQLAVARQDHLKLLDTLQMGIHYFITLILFFIRIIEYNSKKKKLFFREGLCVSEIF